MPAISNTRNPMTQAGFLSRHRGFILLPVVLAITVIAALAYLMNYTAAMNVNSLGKEIESGEARFIAKAGLNHMLWQANKSNCTGYVNIANAFGANSYSATITPTSGSPVSISVTGTHAKGGSYTIKRDRVKVYQAPTTLVMQPGAASGKDTYIYDFKPTLNYGGDNVLNVTKWGGKTAQSLLQFDLGNFQNRSKIISAKLQLYQNYNLGTGPVGVHRVIPPWGEGSQSPGATGPGATWNLRDTSTAWTTPGGDYDATATAIVNAAGIAWTSWDISTLVKAWMAATYPNNGLLLVPETSSTDAYFASSESTLSLFYPKLTLNYACECGQKCSICTAGNFRDDFTLIAYSGNNGSLAWTNSWQESGESDGPLLGRLNVTASTDCASGNCLKIRDDSSSVMRITREANLMTNTESASLSFSYRRKILTTPGSTVKLEISNNGGSSFTLLRTYQFITNDGAQVDELIDISDYLATNTQIRFSTDNSNSGTVEMYVDNVTITPSCKPITIVTLNPIADATIDQNDGDTSGTGTELLVGRDAGGNPNQALLQFDLSSIPPGSTVTNAKLRIYHASKLGTGTYNFVVYRIIDSWTEATVGWPVGYDAGTQLTVLPVKIDATGDWEEWYIPPGLIHEWVDGISPNSGVLVNFESTATNKMAKFSSRETANKPQLVISYTPS